MVASGQQRPGGLRQARAAQVGLGSRGLGVCEVPFDQDGLQPQLPGPLEFVIPAVADEGSPARIGPERLQRHLVDPGIRLEQAGRPGHGRHVDAVPQTEGVEQVPGVPGRVGDDREADTVSAQPVQSREGPPGRAVCPSRARAARH